MCVYASLYLCTGRHGYDANEKTHRKAERKGIVSFPLFCRLVCLQQGLSADVPFLHFKEKLCNAKQRCRHPAITAHVLRPFLSLVALAGVAEMMIVHSSDRVKIEQFDRSVYQIQYNRTYAMRGTMPLNRAAAPSFRTVVWKQSRMLWAHTCM